LAADRRRACPCLFLVSVASRVRSRRPASRRCLPSHGGSGRP